jgi:hypothetical protein
MGGSSRLSQAQDDCTTAISRGNRFRDAVLMGASPTAE